MIKLIPLTRSRRQEAKAADCNSAIVGSNPIGTSNLEDHKSVSALFYLPARSTEEDYSDALLLEGEFVTYQNITITHSERYDSGSVITIRFGE